MRSRTRPALEASRRSASRSTPTTRRGGCTSASATRHSLWMTRRSHAESALSDHLLELRRRERVGQKFCGECGTALAATCSSCGAANPPGRSSAASAERRWPATRLRTGSRRRAAARLGAVRRPRRLHAAVGRPRRRGSARPPVRYFEVAADVIGRYGGVVEKFIGDAVMAVWGTPVAQEDDAERAVRAALELVAAVSAFGGETGMPGSALAPLCSRRGRRQSRRRGQGMVAGDLVNAASRVQGPPSRTPCSSATRHGVQRKRRSRTPMRASTS